MSDKNKIVDSVDRRSVLKSVGVAGGLYGAGFGTTGVVGAAKSGDTVKIVTVKVGDKPLETKEVPAEWWQFEQRAEKIKQRLQSKYKDVPSIEGVGLGNSGEYIGDRLKSSITVQVNPETGTNEPIPNSIEGVAIDVVDAERPDPDVCYNGPHEYVPGGAAVYGGGGATATCPVTLSSGTKGLMTCAHAWDDCYNDITGNKLNQNGQLVGDVETFSSTMDFAVVTMNSNSDISGFDNTIVDTGRDLRGRVTRSGLKDLKSTGETVHHKGRRSPCDSSGQVTDLDVKVGRCGCDTDCSFMSWDYVKLSTPTKSGDSGGPHYKTYSYNGQYYAAIIAPHHGGESVGCGAYRIHNVHDITFQI